MYLTPLPEYSIRVFTTVTGQVAAAATVLAAPPAKNASVFVSFSGAAAGAPPACHSPNHAGLLFWPLDKRLMTTAILYGWQDACICGIGAYHACASEQSCLSRPPGRSFECPGPCSAARWWGQCPSTRPCARRNITKGFQSPRLVQCTGSSGLYITKHHLTPPSDMIFRNVLSVLSRAFFVASACIRVLTTSKGCTHTETMAPAREPAQ